MSRGRSNSQPPAGPTLELAVVVGDGITMAPLPSRSEVILGRGEECDIRIDSRAVSRRHAVLHLGSPLRIEDLGSANGTFVRDARAPTDTASTQPFRKLSRERMEIAIGEVVLLGSVPIVVRRAAAYELPSSSSGTIVRDPRMQAIYKEVTRAARSDLSVLILGETGVGKEVLARAVHEQSPRARGPYQEINCGALAQSLVEGELFGHEKNAFTGADKAQPGLLESADGGTVFLDEVGELPLAVQVKLLRVIEDHKVLRIGSRTPRKLDVRFVAATNRDLEAEIARGTFREDLYHRLNAFTVVIPPLRERVAEIVPLAEQFLVRASQLQNRVEPLRLSSETIRYLERYTWPGNVRELRNVIERAVVLSSGGVIVPADLPGPLTGASRVHDRAVPIDAAEMPMGPAPEVPSERQRIVEALEQCAGNQTRTAKLLGISLRTLVNRLEKYNLPRPRRRP